MQQPELKKISELLSMEFFIPSYQRGYRWTKFEVRELLEDLKQLTEKTPDTKYCLQPLIVKKIENKNDCYEVIDGQQRLTTIYLIMKFISTLIDDKSLKEYYTIEYETRQDSKNFLENINISNSFMDTPDFYYMHQAYITISKWFDEQNQKLFMGVNIDKFLKENVFVIFYNVDNGTDSMELFRKVNIGKIPLTSSELIKALLLTSIEDKEQYRIAYEWDLIEQNLQNESLWYFLCNDAKDNNRIELLFDIYADMLNADKALKISKEQKYFEFIVVYNALKEKLLTPDEIWTEIKNINSNISNWYNDIDNYHMIGFLLAIKSKKTSQEKIKEYIKATYQKNKSDIREFFIKEIKNNLNINYNDDIEEIPEYAYDFESDKVKIRKLLLLFNIATLILRSEKQYRFSFEIYKKNSWDIEHIHATNDSSAEADNFIQNLTLLDSGTNRAYKDKPFNEKRAIIIEKEKYGQFIPLCTKNVFLKQYTENVKDMKDWNEDDKQCYVSEIKSIIKEFLLGDK